MSCRNIFILGRIVRGFGNSSRVGLALVLFAAACGGSESGTGGNGAGGSAGNQVEAGGSGGSSADGAVDSGKNVDATMANDAADATPEVNDAEGGGATDVTDAFAKPHLLFVTSSAYTGDLVREANALLESSADSGVRAPDSGTFGPSDWQAAADAICQGHAARAGIDGTFLALLGTWGGADGGGTSFFDRIADSDGPWALANGDAVATTAAELAYGGLRTAIDVTETGSTYPYDPFAPGGAAAWAPPVGQGMDCGAWSDLGTEASTRYGHVGAMRYTGIGSLNSGVTSCNTPHPLYCVQVGAGGTAVSLPALPAGAKVAFITAGTLSTDFAAPSDGGTAAEGGAAPDAVHVRADAFCNAAAADAGKSGAFHAWVSSAASSAQAYFAGLGMNGPWYRPDGFLVAESRDELVRAVLGDGGPASLGVKNQIEIDARGGFRIQPVMTGTNEDGTTGPNCNDFGASTSTDGGAAQTRSCLPIFKDFEWASRNVTDCAALGSAALYCFQE